MLKNTTAENKEAMSSSDHTQNVINKLKVLEKEVYV